MVVGRRRVFLPPLGNARGDCIAIPMLLSNLLVCVLIDRFIALNICS